MADITIEVDGVTVKEARDMGGQVTREVGNEGLEVIHLILNLKAEIVTEGEVFMARVIIECRGLLMEVTWMSIVAVWEVIELDDVATEEGEVATKASVLGDLTGGVFGTSKKT